MVRWLLPVTLVLLVLGACWGLLVAPPDFRQGNSYRIIYIHVPAAVVALAGYYVMAIAGAISLIWRIKMADVAMRAAARGRCTDRCCIGDRRDLGQADMGRLVGMGCADYVYADPILPLSRRGRIV